MKPTIYAAAIALAFVATTARADIITQTDGGWSFSIFDELAFTSSGSGSTTITNLDSGLFGNNADPLAFDLFDPSLGTLNSVAFDWTLSGEMEVGIFVDGPGFQPGSGTVDAAAELSFMVNLPGAAGVSDSTSVAGSHTGSIAGPPGVGSSDAAELAFPIAVGSALFTTPADLAPFIGIGQFDLTASLALTVFDYLATGPGGQGGIRAGIPFPDLDFTVVYDFTPADPGAVPEPGSLALLGLGLGSLALIRRRRPTAA